MASSLSQYARQRIRLIAILASLSSLLPLWTAIAPSWAIGDPRADVVIYGDHALKRFRTGNKFATPFNHQVDRTPGSVDPVTRLSYEAAPGIRNTLGAQQWGLATFGKYVIPGDYSDLSTLFVDGGTDDHRLGIFDSERKTFCKLDIEIGDDLMRLATSRTIATANPTARRSRIFFAGNDNGCYARCTSDLCSQSPCYGESHKVCNRGDLCPAEQSAAFGWIEADLDAEDPCTEWPAMLGPRIELAIDGLAILTHEDVPGDPYGRDYVVLNAYNLNAIVLVRVDSLGAAILHQFVEPLFSVAVPNIGSCFYGRAPVQLPQVDRTRPLNEIRFISSFDVLRAHPLNPDCPFLTEGHHSQEYRVDLTSPTPTIDPVGPYFFGTTSHNSSDSLGGMHLNSSKVYKPAPPGGICFRNGIPSAATPGERCTYDPAHTNDTVDILPSQVLTFEGGCPVRC